MFSPPSRANPTAVVLYDADCGFCRWSADTLLAADRRRRLRSVAIQSPEGDELLAAIAPQRRLESWHLVTTSGALISGAAAGAPLLELLPGGRLPARLLRRFPGATERVYGLVAANRGRLARLPGVDPRRRPRR